MEQNRKPEVGQIVGYFDLTDRALEHNAKIHQNHANFSPAIVTATWGDKCINVRVLPDGTGTFWRTSTMHLSEAIAYNNPSASGWFFLDEKDFYIDFLKKNEQSSSKLNQE